MAAAFNATWIVTVQAPSGAEKKTELESFYDTDILHLLLVTKTDILFAGDFNCVFHPADRTGQTNYTRALENLVRVFYLHDVCDASHEMATPITHHVRRRDWIGYMSPNTR